MTELKIRFLKHYTVYVEVTEDYHVKGSFDPNAACDIDYFGVRDTEFEVIEVIDHRRNRAKLPMHEEERNYWVEQNYNRLLLAVQDELDKVDVD